MDRVERVQCVLDGRPPDRAPVSFWHHFPPDQVFGRPALDAHLRHVETYDLDFLKVMNDNAYPHEAIINSADDLASLTVLRGDEPPFAKQLDLLADLKRALGGRLLMATTLFNAWTTLRKLVAPPKRRHNPPNLDATEDARTATILRFFEQDATAVATALGTLAASLANFARRCLAAGADGVFLSVRDDWLSPPAAPQALYRRLVRETDLTILRAAAAGRFNLLHICGRPQDFRAFADYPVHAINWADRAAGPAIREVRGWAAPALCAGIDNLSTLPEGSPEACAQELADALKQADDRPILIAPGCTYDPDAVSPDNLKALCRAVRG